MSYDCYCDATGSESWSLWHLYMYMYMYYGQHLATRTRALRFRPYFFLWKPDYLTNAFFLSQLLSKFHCTVHTRLILHLASVPCVALHIRSYYKESRTPLTSYTHFFLLRIYISSVILPFCPVLPMNSRIKCIYYQYLVYKFCLW